MPTSNVHQMCMDWQTGAEWDPEHQLVECNQYCRQIRAPGKRVSRAWILQLTNGYSPQVSETVGEQHQQPTNLTKSVSWLLWKVYWGYTRLTSLSRRPTDIRTVVLFHKTRCKLVVGSTLVQCKSKLFLSSQSYAWFSSDCTSIDIAHFSTLNIFGRMSCPKSMMKETIVKDNGVHIS